MIETQNSRFPGQESNQCASKYKSYNSMMLYLLISSKFHV